MSLESKERMEWCKRVAMKPAGAAALRQYVCKMVSNLVPAAGLACMESADLMLEIKGEATMSF